MKKIYVVFTVMAALVLLLSACSSEEKPTVVSPSSGTDMTSGTALPADGAMSGTDTSGTTMQGGTDTSGTLMPAGTDTSGTTMPAGTDTTGTLMPAATDTTGTLMPAATDTSGTTMLAGTTMPGTTMPAPTGPANIMIGKNAKLGSFLQDDKGRTLYMFTKDTPKTSTCYDTCATSWLPLLTKGTPVAATGIDATKLGTTKRTDGSEQVTYAGFPLYYFAKDVKAGDTNGQNVTSLWFVISPEGLKITK